MSIQVSCWGDTVWARWISRGLGTLIGARSPVSNCMPCASTRCLAADSGAKAAGAGSNGPAPIPGGNAIDAGINGGWPAGRPVATAPFACAEESWGVLWGTRLQVR